MFWFFFNILFTLFYLHTDTHLLFTCIRIFVSRCHHKMIWMLTEWCQFKKGFFFLSTSALLLFFRLSLDVFKPFQCTYTSTDSHKFVVLSLINSLDRVHSFQHSHAEISLSLFFICYYFVFLFQLQVFIFAVIAVAFLLLLLLNLFCFTMWRFFRSRWPHGRLSLHLNAEIIHGWISKKYCIRLAKTILTKKCLICWQEKLTVDKTYALSNLT